MTQKSLLNSATLKFQAPLDPGFAPFYLGLVAYEAAVAKASKREVVDLALERENGLVHREHLEIIALGSTDDATDDADTYTYVERVLKFLLWSRGAWQVHISGPKLITDQIAGSYSSNGSRAFDTRIMSQGYGKQFGLRVCSSSELPPAKESSSKIGGHLKGCRIGFDLGASDFKISAVIDGESVYSAEFPWHPKDQSDPQYHYDKINFGLKEAAKHLPRIDAIGGSSAGICVNNQIMVASLFRSVPLERYDSEVKPIFHRLAKEWGVPLLLINDGEVTALAGAMSLNTTGVLGVAMGSSQAGGFVTPSGQLTTWLNELAFLPVDLNPQAPPDEWSQDRGVGALYFSQQAVNKLLPSARIEAPSEMGLPERLLMVQELSAKGDVRAASIYKTIGVYLGYSIPLYARFYDYQHLLVLGRVLTGKGGDIIVDTANAILKAEFPEFAKQIELHVPDERSRRIGQSVAAASLPAL